MFGRFAVWAVMIALAQMPAHAITWADLEVDDPFSDGVCAVHEPMSSGSYIYDYPSKWDGVYWPHTDPYWIWRCPDSGYVAFGNEFEELDESQKEKIAAWLKAHSPVQGDDPLPYIARLVELDQFRTRDAMEAAWFKRLMAYWHDERDPAAAERYRREAVLLMIEALPTAEKPDQAQLLFLMGVYAEKFGSSWVADICFGRARQVKWTDEDGKEAIGIPYFNEMIDELVANRANQPSADKPPQQ